MNWKQKIVLDYIGQNFAAGSVRTYPAGPAGTGFTVKDSVGGNMYFWLDEASGYVFDSCNHPATYKKLKARAAAQKAESITVTVEADTADAQKKIDALANRANDIVAALEKATTQAERLSAMPICGIDLSLSADKAPTHHAEPRFDTIPAGYMAAADAPTDEDSNPYAFGLGYQMGAMVFCSDCGHAIKSAYGSFTDQATADQYARENCPECAHRNADAKARYTEQTQRTQFVRELESIVRKAERTVHSLEHVNPGKDGETIVIHYASTQTRVPISGNSLLAIAKSVMEALPY